MVMSSQPLNVVLVVRILLDTILLLFHTVKILLPIFCILTLVVCVGMSIFTHYWYPYIDSEGKKRSKTKPIEYVYSDSHHGINVLLIVCNYREPQPTVWRPRPTIRFR